MGLGRFHNILNKGGIYLGKYIDVDQLAAEYENADIAGILTEIEDWKNSLSGGWDDDIVLSTLETVEDIIIDNLYKE